MAEAGNVTINIAVDAFLFNPAVCESRIAPITQPNYDYLSLQQEKVRADVFPPHDLQYSIPATINSRLVDIGTGEIRANRIGVYVHWILPTVYRTGEASAGEGLRKKRNSGLEGKERSRADAMTTPEYKPVPNRYLVIRRIKDGTMVPSDATVPEIEGWIVESDRLRDVTELTGDIDTQVDVSPYVSPEEAGQPPRHGRDFIGYKTTALGWTEDATPRRVDLNVLSSSNQLFADYQPHNTNVFSICDNFSYTVNGQTKYLESCSASYLIFGWHSDETKDPMYYLSPARATLPGLLSRLDKNHIHLIDEEGEMSLEALIATSGDSATGADANWTLLWGAIHNVQWSSTTKPETPADAATELFKDPLKLPIAIGTGPLDALFAYIQSQDDDEIQGVEELILKIQTLLISQQDGVDEQNAAEDLLRNSDYDRFDGGIRWYLSGKEDESAVDPEEEDGGVLPPDESIAALRQANAIQAKLDTLLRTLPTLQWKMFSYWWKYLCDHALDHDPVAIREEVAVLSARLAQLLSQEGPQSVYYKLPRLVLDMISNQVKLPTEAGAVERFYHPQEPTLLIAGLESGWPKDHTKETKARMGVHFKTGRFSAPAAADSGTTSAQTLMDELIKVMPNTLHQETQALANAFLNVGDTGETSDEQAVWTKQPWCPLFLEWEIEYYHIPFKHWRMDRYQANNSSTMQHIRWGIESETDVGDVPDVLDNMRTINGRVLLLPQPAFSLGAQVEQLFTNVPEDLLDKHISKEEREQLVSDLANSFPYMSSPLSGLRNHLLTLQQGTHYNPNQRTPESEEAVPTHSAVVLTKDFIGLGEDELRQVGDETAATPYAVQVSGLPKNFEAFKPVTHGQFRFTKLNIVDKFGQSISVVNHIPGQHPSPVYPCVSEMYTVQRLGGGDVPNVVIKDNTTPDGACEFIQIPPRINQPTRLNTCFMVEDPTDGWRPADEWENPIFGWMLINFANYGLQVFLPDGRFYREIRLGGASGATASQPFLPFSPPDPPPQVNPELDLFLKAMQDNKAYLQGVYKMILDAFKNMEEAPNSYAEFLSALVGKPVALTNVGFSFELDTAKKKDQTVYPPSNIPPPEKDILEYELPLKIGDEKRVYDGLVGYFYPGQPEKIYTYCTNDIEGSPTTAIDVTTYPVLKPFFIDPGDSEPQDYVKDRDSRLHRVVALLDPFVALHGYNGLSPIAEVKLPNWTVETAMKQMTMFFHLGPVVATKDVPGYDAEHRLTAEYGGEVKPYPGKGLAIPAGLKKEEWIWLQPYTTGSELDKLEFMALNVDATEEKVRWEPAPYTAVEGYLQLKRAFGGPPPAPDDDGGEEEKARVSFESSKGWTGVGTSWIR